MQRKVVRSFTNSDTNVNYERLVVVITLLFWIDISFHHSIFKFSVAVLQQRVTHATCMWSSNASNVWKKNVKQKLGLKENRPSFFVVLSFPFLFSEEKQNCHWSRRLARFPSCSVWLVVRRHDARDLMKSKKKERKATRVGGEPNIEETKSV